MAKQSNKGARYLTENVRQDLYADMANAGTLAVHRQSERAMAKSAYAETVLDGATESVEHFESTGEADKALFFTRVGNRAAKQMADAQIVFEEKDRLLQLASGEVHVAYFQNPEDDTLFRSVRGSLIRQFVGKSPRGLNSVRLTRELKSHYKVHNNLWTKWTAKDGLSAKQIAVKIFNEWGGSVPLGDKAKDAMNAATIKGGRVDATTKVTNPTTQGNVNPISNPEMGSK